MAVDEREAVFDGASGAPASVDLGVGTESTDLLVAVGECDWYTLASGFGPPSGDGWEEIPNSTADLGENNTKIRGWWKVAEAGAQTITLAPINGDVDVGLTVWVLTGADLADPVADAAAQTSPGGGPPSEHVCPSVTGTAGGRLLLGVATSVFNGGAAYGHPPGTTEVAEASVSTFMTFAAASEALAADGATGARTWEYGGTNDPGVGVAIAVRAAEEEPPDPAEGTAALGLGLELAATGSRESAGIAGPVLGLELAASGARDSAGAAAPALGLELAAAGARQSAGTAAPVLGLQLAATGARPSQGEAHLNIGLALVASAFTVLHAAAPPGRTLVVPPERRVVDVPAERRIVDVR